jgi:hypothetical protein
VQKKLTISVDSKSVAVSKDLLLLLLLFSFLPLFRCGLREKLNFWQWVYYHTTFAPKPQYIPEEDYQQKPET